MMENSKKSAFLNLHNFKKEINKADKPSITQLGAGFQPFSCIRKTLYLIVVAPTRYHEHKNHPKSPPVSIMSLESGL
jgi:hypothetical protein